MMNDVMTGDNISNYLVADVGAPFVIGLAVGYFAKKALKMALFFGGMAIVLLFVSEYYGFVDISDESLKQVTNTATDAAKASGSFLVDRLSHITGKGLSAVAGFAIGLKVA